MVFLVYADANEPRKPNTATVSNTGGRKTPKALSGIETKVADLFLHKFS